METFLEIIWAFTKVLGLTFALGSIPIILFTLYFFWWIRRHVKGKVLVVYMGEDNYAVSTLLEPNNSEVKLAIAKVGDNGKRTKTESTYQIDPEKAVLTLWPEGPGIPEFAKYPVPTYYYKEGTSKPFSWFSTNRQSQTLSAAARRQINDESFLRQAIQVAREVASDREVKAIVAMKPLLIAVVVVAAIAMVATIATSLITYFGYLETINTAETIARIAEVLGIESLEEVSIP